MHNAVPLQNIVPFFFAKIKELEISYYNVFIYNIMERDRAEKALPHIVE